MLELRPSCEHCDTDLAPSADARICSFECTFCPACAEGPLGDVCPNCGGNFVPRPVRPANDWRGGNYLGAHPASVKRKFRPVDLQAHRELLARLAGMAPALR
jgi:hypothetical protein